jgi:ribosomal protein S18 acetylase RimI-like enzyme
MNFVVASKEQLPIVRELAFIIWPDTFENILSSEQIEYMLDMMYSIESLEKQLENNKVFLLAEDENRFVGFTSYELNFDNNGMTKIHKLYVLPETQGKGVGRQLIDYIAEIALANQNNTLHLTVNKNNKATDFYLKTGFEITEEVVFDIGNGYVMDDYIMEKKL